MNGKISKRREGKVRAADRLLASQGEWYMPKLKGIRVTVKGDAEVVVVPLYWSKRGGSQVGSALKNVAPTVIEAVEGVLARLAARGDLGQ